MIQYALTHKKTNKRSLFFEDTDFENKNPIEHYGNKTIVKQMILNGVSISELNGEKKFTTISNGIFRKALYNWLNLKKEFQAIKVSENLIELLKTDQKKDQEYLLQDFLFTSETLTALSFTAYHNFGYTLSQYSPKVSKKRYNAVKKPFAKIIDCKDNWHCFFIMNTNLNEKIQEPDNTITYLYYISKAFGIDRSHIVNVIKTDVNQFKNLPHIKLQYLE